MQYTDTTDPATGLQLQPGKPDSCPGNGDTIGQDGQRQECCCDECDYYLECFPNWKQQAE